MLRKVVMWLVLVAYSLLLRRKGLLRPDGKKS